MNISHEVNISLEEQVRDLGYGPGSLHSFHEDMVRAYVIVITARNMSISMFNAEKRMKNEQFEESQNEVMNRVKQAHDLIAEMRNFDCFGIGEPKPKTLRDLEREALLSAMETEAVCAEERVLQAITNRQTRSGSAKDFV